ncbi:MAG: hypothetical protein CL946_06470 [Ectothiorhodospiraceae bacterium]|nr:hypothetical protein [Ectothiorhodospiraceae bacterium]
MMRFLLLILPLYTFQTLAQVAVAPEELAFPLIEGSTWIYNGTIKWNEGGDSHYEKEIEWTMRIDSVTTRQHVTAALLTGYPLDLAWWEPGRTPRTRTLICVNGKDFFLTDSTAYSRVRDNTESLIDLVKESELFLRLPLVKYRAFGETSQITRTDGMYVWWVEDHDTDAPWLLNGERRTFDALYTITMRTLPSYLSYQFVPGVGIVRFRYHHNGSVSDVDVSLTATNNE